MGILSPTWDDAGDSYSVRMILKDDGQVCLSCFDHFHFSIGETLAPEIRGSSAPTLQLLVFLAMWEKGQAL